MTASVPAAWATWSSALAPVLLVGGWSLADAVQAAPFDPVSGTISALAALDADHRWVMTAALVGVGTCHAVTAWGLQGAGRPGRLVLALGGLATLGVAAAPLPGGDGGSTAHALAAGTAFAALALWPVVAVRRDGAGPWRPSAGVTAGAVLLGLVGWFAVELGGDRVGLAERVAAGAQALWPLVAVRWAARAGRTAD